MPTGIYDKEKRRKFLTEEHKKKIGDSNRGKKRSEEIKQKCRERQLGKNMYERTEDYKQKMSTIMTGRNITAEWRLRISLSTRGDKSYRWRGGITPINKKIRGSMEYRAWRMAVFTRDNFTCVWCGAKNGNGKHIELNADHIKPFSTHPELRLDINNGRTLCQPCHLKTPTHGRNTKKLISNEDIL